MTQISIFGGYPERETSITRACGVLLEILSDISPSEFEKVIREVTGFSEYVHSKDIKFKLEEHFQSEEDDGSSRADLSISDKGFRAIFEMKLNEGSFYEEQFEKYVKNVKNRDEKVFLCAVAPEFANEDKFSKIEDRIKEKGMSFKKITFEKLLSIIRNAKIDDKVYSLLLGDFDEVLKKRDPGNWKNSLFAFPCLESIEDVKNYGVHVGTYGKTPSKKTKYFAPSFEKKISCVFEIDCVVRVRDEKREPEIIHNQKKISEDEIKMRVDSFLDDSGRRGHFQSKDKVKKHGMCLFLLNKESMEDTCVTEANLSQGGIYLYNIAKGLNNSKDLAKRMDGKTFYQLKESEEN